MREYKYRMWDKEEEEMYYNILEDRTHDCDMYMIYEELSTGEREDFEYMQFTGFFDIKNNPIYENDILHISEVSMGNMEDPNINLKYVGWDGENACFRLYQVNGEEQSAGYTFSRKNAAGYFKIVGNIFENSILLEKKLEE